MRVTLPYVRTLQKPSGDAYNSLEVFEALRQAARPEPKRETDGLFVHDARSLNAVRSRN